MERQHENAIIAFVKVTFDVTVTRESLVAMNPEFVTDIYKLFLYAIGFENLHQPDLQAIAGITHIERYDEFIFKSNLVKVMQKILEAKEFKGPKFTFMDIIRPQRKRTLIIFNLLMQVCVRYDDAKNIRAQYMEELAPRLMQCQELREKNDHQRQELEKLSALVARQKAEKDAKTRIVAEETSKLNVLREKCKEIEATYAAEKQALLELKSDVAEKELTVKQMKEKLESSKRLLVASPEEFHQKVAEMKQSISTMQAETRERDLVAIDKKVEIDAINTLLEKYEVTKKTMIDPLFDHVTTLKEKSDHARHLTSEKATLEVQLQQKQRLLRIAEEKLQSKRAELAQLKSSEERDLAPLKQLIASTQADKAKAEEKLAKLTLEMDQIKEDHEARMRKVEDLFNAFDERRSFLLSHMKEKRAEVEALLKA